MGSFYKNKYFRRRSDTRWVLTVNTSSRGTLSTGLVLVHIMMNVVNKMSFETKYCQCLEHSFYSLKWYRDDREFFRYIPQGRPQRPQRCTFSKDPKTNYHCLMLTTFSHTNYKRSKHLRYLSPRVASSDDISAARDICVRLFLPNKVAFSYIFIYISIYWTLSFCHCSQRKYLYLN